MERESGQVCERERKDTGKKEVLKKRKEGGKVTFITHVHVKSPYYFPDSPRCWGYRVQTRCLFHEASGPGVEKKKKEEKSNSCSYPDGRKGQQGECKTGTVVG